MASAQRIRFAALALSLALVAGACGGSKDDKSTSAAKRRATTSSTDSTLVSDSSTTAGAAAQGVTTTTKKGATTTTPKGGATATTAKPAVTAAPTTPPTADPNAVPEPAKNGTYGYSQSGNTPDGPVPAHGTLVVSGGSTESFKRYFDTSKGPQTLTFVFRPDGPFITGATVASNGVTITCSFGSPVPLPPWPPNPGRTFSGTASCSNGITATLSGSVTSHSGDIVGISSNLHATGSGVDVTVHDTESWSKSLRVPKSSHQTYSGTALGQPISGDVTSTLTSTP